MSGGLVTAAYIVAAILFIFSLAGLSKHETSQQGNNFGIAGMAIALIATIFGPDTGNVAWILVAMIIGGAIGIRLAKRVEMTEMPELVAILHSFVGLAAVLVGFNSYLYHEPGLEPILVNIHLTEVFLGIFIGAVTFTGSIVAFGKLRGKIVLPAFTAAKPCSKAKSSHLPAISSFLISSADLMRRIRSMKLVMSKSKWGLLNCAAKASMRATGSCPFSSAIWSGLT